MSLLRMSKKRPSDHLNNTNKEGTNCEGEGDKSEPLKEKDEATMKQAYHSSETTVRESSSSPTLDYALLRSQDTVGSMGSMAGDFLQLMTKEEAKIEASTSATTLSSSHQMFPSNGGTQSQESTRTVDGFLDSLRSLTTTSKPAEEPQHINRHRPTSPDDPEAPLSVYLTPKHNPEAASLARAGLELDIPEDNDDADQDFSTMASQSHHSSTSDAVSESSSDDAPRRKSHPRARVSTKQIPKRGKRTCNKTNVRDVNRVRKRMEPAEREYVEYADEDVLCQRGGLGNKHPGNQRYLSLKQSMQSIYMSTPKSGRAIVAQQLVDQVRELGGRFLRQDSHGWYEIHNHTARTKAGQALREDLTAEDRAAKREKYRKKGGSQISDDQSETSYLK